MLYTDRWSSPVYHTKCLPKVLTSTPSTCSLRNFLSPEFGTTFYREVPSFLPGRLNLRGTVKWVPVKGRWCSAVGKVTADLAESNGSLPPGGWLIDTCGLPVHRDQLRAQRSVTSMGSFNLLPYFWRYPITRIPFQYNNRIKKRTRSAVLYNTGLWPTNGLRATATCNRFTALV